MRGSWQLDDIIIDCLVDQNQKEPTLSASLQERIRELEEEETSVDGSEKQKIDDDDPTKKSEAISETPFDLLVQYNRRQEGMNTIP